jgi:hypothetical protein
MSFVAGILLLLAFGGNFLPDLVAQLLALLNGAVGGPPTP